jgi:hypothetical protein
VSRSSVVERFEAKLLAAGDCWIWNAKRAHNGYGQFYVSGRQVIAHRFSYELHVGPIPEGLQIDHLCRVRACVNPAHLEVVTHAENMRRIRRSHCIHQHPLTDDNVYFDKVRGKRHCRECRRERVRAGRAA